MGRSSGTIIAAPLEAPRGFYLSVGRAFDMASSACLTCGNPVHWTTKVCPNCGRHNPTTKDFYEKTDQEKAMDKADIDRRVRALNRNRAKSGIFGFIRFALVIAGLALAFHFFRSMRNSNEISQTDVATTQSTPEEPNLPQPKGQQLPENPPQPTARSETPESPSNSTDNAAVGDQQFPYKAQLIDDRGAIVLQSEPSIFGKNLA